MRGEWWFEFKGEKLTLDLHSYQKMLIDIKQEYKTSFSEGTSFWCGDDPNDLPPKDNIFARFTYSCTRGHALHNPYGSPGDEPVWYLFWDPTIVDEKTQWSEVHASCAPREMRCKSIDIQMKLAKAFPKHFQLYLGNGRSGLGPQCNQYFGVCPVSYAGRYDGRGRISYDGHKFSKRYNN